MNKIKQLTNDPRLVLVGGWEFMKDDGIDKEIARLANGKIVLIPDASNFPEKQIDRAIEKYKKYDTEILLLDNDAPVIPKNIRVVYIGGGQPAKLIEYFKHHPELLQNIKSRWHKKEIIWCGSSTGAMVVTKEMLAPNSYGQGEVDLEPSLTLIKNNAIFIPHWDSLDTQEKWRRKILTAHREKPLVTIDEYTSFFWYDNKAKVVGLGKVNIARNGDIKTYRDGETISDFPLIL